MSFNQAGSPGGNDLVTGFQPFGYYNIVFSYQSGFFDLATFHLLRLGIIDKDKFVVIFFTRYNSGKRRLNCSLVKACTLDMQHHATGEADSHFVFVQIKFGIVDI